MKQTEQSLANRTFEAKPSTDETLTNSNTLLYTYFSAV